MHLLAKIFERYGNTNNISKEYKKLGQFFSSQCAVPILNTLLMTLVETNKGRYMSPRVLQKILVYLKLGVSVAVTWKVLKDSILEVIQKVVFPLLCHSDEDEELWKEDPYEYIRMKFDVFEDFVSPVSTALALIEEVVTKRKNMLSPLLHWAAQLLATPQDQYNPRIKVRRLGGSLLVAWFGGWCWGLSRFFGFGLAACFMTQMDPIYLYRPYHSLHWEERKDGAMHLIGAVSEKLLKKSEYASQIENMLQVHVLQDFQSPHGFLRTRACWVVQKFSGAKFSNRDTLRLAFEGVRVLLLNDKELPVQVEAAFALQTLLTRQPVTKDLLSPHVGAVIQKLLEAIKETENEDLTFVMQVSQNQKIMPKIENILADLISTILKGRIVDYYEEVFQMIQILTALRVSSVMWNVLFQIYEAFKADGADYFTDMMGSLHNYATVDSAQFLANPQYIEIMYNISKTVLKSEESEDPQYNALKLVEVIIINHRGKVDNMLHMFMGLALDKLAQSVQTVELRAVALLVVVAGIWYNPTLAMVVLQRYKLPQCGDQGVTEQFFNQLFSDTDVFMGIHDKKVLQLLHCVFNSS
eukprot:sb/3463348/